MRACAHAEEVRLVRGEVCVSEGVMVVVWTEWWECGGIEVGVRRDNGESVVG